MFIYWFLVIDYFTYIFMLTLHIPQTKFNVLPFKILWFTYDILSWTEDQSCTRLIITLTACPVHQCTLSLKSPLGTRAHCQSECVAFSLFAVNLGLFVIYVFIFLDQFTFGYLPLFLSKCHKYWTVYAYYGWRKKIFCISCWKEKKNYFY